MPVFLYIYIIKNVPRLVEPRHMYRGDIVANKEIAGLE